ncbi:MAG: hypothetical protein HY709_08705 [Candidatus Latescibacteria bacterium]|nr:hypothetical protein [Candidatus Latescibacterota bacterium]
MSDPLSSTGSSTPQITLWTYPWDILDEGPATAVARMKATGADAVSVAVVYHTMEQVRPHLGGTTLDHPDTVACFAPNDARYRDTPLRPPFVPRQDVADPLGAIAEACTEAGLTLHAWTICCHVVTLGRAYPDLCQVNALGDRLLATLCPSQPAVQAYLIGLVSDVVSRYPIRRFELESLQYHNRWSEALQEKNALPFGPVEGYLRGLCVCSACCRRAEPLGVDTSRVAALAREHLHRFAQSGEPSHQTLAEFVTGDTDLLSYHRMRQETLRALIRACHEAAAPAGTCVFFFGNEYGAGLRIGQIVDDVTITGDLFYSAELETNMALLDRRLKEDRIDPARLLASISGFGAQSPDAPALSRTMVTMAKRGVGYFGVYNYGIMRLEQLDWVRQAIEAAKAL